MLYKTKEIGAVDIKEHKNNRRLIIKCGDLLLECKILLLVIVLLSVTAGKTFLKVENEKKFYSS